MQWTRTIEIHSFQRMLWLNLVMFERFALFKTQYVLPHPNSYVYASILNSDSSIDFRTIVPFSIFCLIRMQLFCFRLFTHLFEIFCFDYFRDTMGFSGQMNGWGLCAKYSLFVANFVIFVSVEFELNIISFIAWFRATDENLFNVIRLVVPFCLVWASGR